MEEYRFSRRSPVCMACGEEFRQGDVVVSAIHLTGEGFVRRDVREDHFDGGQDAYSFWRTRIPESEEEERKLDLDLALAFLQRLLREADPAREGLSYLLTLLLSRKRRVKLRETRPLPDGELLVVDLPGPEGDERVQVPAPRLGDEEVAALQAELERLFGLSG